MYKVTILQTSQVNRPFVFVVASSKSTPATKNVRCGKSKERVITVTLDAIKTVMGRISRSKRISPFWLRTALEESFDREGEARHAKHSQ
jgi:hypothetical protein